MTHNVEAKPLDLGAAAAEHLLCMECSNSAGVWDVYVCVF